MTDNVFGLLCLVGTIFAEIDDNRPGILAENAQITR